MGMDQAIISRIAQDLGLPENFLSAAVTLFESGATAPFIAQYRKELIGGLDAAKVRAIEERLAYYKDILDRRAALIKLLTEQNKLSVELQQKIDGIYSKVELEDLFHLYKPRKKTRAAEAQEKGLTPLAEYVWGQEPDAWSLEVHAEAYKDAEKQIASGEQALQGALEIIAEWISEKPEIRTGLREMLWSEGQVVSTVVPAKANQKTKYTMYYNRREAVSTIPSHRVLAIRRGTKEGVLTSAIECDPAKALEFILATVIRDRESIFAPLIERSARDAYSRILRPLIETEVRAMLKERADREAIRVFQDNLSNLLLTPPAGAMVVMGVDIAKGDECRVAVVDENGKLLDEAAINLKPPRPAAVAVETAVVAEKPAETPAEVPAEAAAISDAPALPALDVPAAPEAATAEAATAEAATAEAATAEAASKIPPTEEVSVNSIAETASEIPSAEATAEAPVAEAASESAIASEVQATAEITVEAPAESQPPISESAEAPVAEIIAVPAEAAPEVAETVASPAEESPAGETASTEIVETAGLAEAAAGAAADLLAEAPVAQDENGHEEPAATAAIEETAPVRPKKQIPTAHGPEEARVLLRELIARHSVRALAIGASAGNRNLETMLRQILAEEKIEDVLVASVNDAGVAIYASSRIAREELPEQSVSARCAVSMARRLQDPLAELVKIDPKLIGVGQYQHDVDQKELHRSLVQVVRACVNSVGADPNTASHSLLRYVSGFNDKLARKLITTRNNNGAFTTRAAMMSIPGIDEATFRQSAGFLRIRGGENPLDRTAVHPEAYSVVDKIAANLNVSVADLVGNRELVANLRFEDYVTDEWGPMTLHDIREELLRPGRDPRRSFVMPKFRADVREITDLKEGMDLDGTVTNVTNFGAFIDIGVRQDGLVHLSQMSNRFIRDPREAVKVGDVVQVKVISVEPETKRIGLSMKALLPAIPKKRKKVIRRPGRPGEQGARSAAAPRTAPQPSETGQPAGDVAASSAPPQGRRPQDRRRPPNRRGPRPANRSPRNEARDEHPRSAASSSPAAGELAPQAQDPDLPQQTLQEKIAILQSKFRGIK